ncbi:MAG: hypothetical protein ACFE85_05005 [Candidatus Hodarchaeota archaeon]
MKIGTILILDNDVESNNLAKHFLIKGGYKTITATKILDGLEIIKKKFNEIVLILLEPALKDSSYLIKTIKENENYTHIKIIIYLSKKIKKLDYNDAINFFKF